MVRDLSSKLDDVKEDVRAGNVTLGWIAVGELDCTRLVFIFPAPRAEHRSLARRFADKVLLPPGS